MKVSQFPRTRERERALRRLNKLLDEIYINRHGLRKTEVLNKSSVPPKSPLSINKEGFSGNYSTDLDDFIEFTGIDREQMARFFDLDVVVIESMLARFKRNAPPGTPVGYYREAA